MNYVADDNGRTNAIAGYHDDTVIALAIVLEVIRTHGDKLTTSNVPFSQKSGSFAQLETTWI